MKINDLRNKKNKRMGMRQSGRPRRKEGEGELIPFIIFVIPFMLHTILVMDPTL